jgi:hypothetical protein
MCQANPVIVLIPKIGYLTYILAATTAYLCIRYMKRTHDEDLVSFVRMFHPRKC